MNTRTKTVEPCAGRWTSDSSETLQTCIHVQINIFHYHFIAPNMTGSQSPDVRQRSLNINSESLQHSCRYKRKRDIRSSLSFGQEITLHCSCVAYLGRPHEPRHTAATASQRAAQTCETHHSRRWHVHMQMHMYNTYT